MVAVGELLLSLLATTPTHGPSADAAGKIRVSAAYAGPFDNYPSNASVDLDVSRGPLRAPRPARSKCVSLP